MTNEINTKTLFSDLDAEKELIALICNHPSYFRDVQKVITSDILFHSVTKQAYIACEQLYSESGTIHFAELILRLKSKGSNDWITIMDAQTTRNPLTAQELLFYLAELKGKRDIMNLSRQLNNDLANGIDYHELRTKISSVLDNDIVPSDNTDIIPMSEALNTALQNIGEVMTNGSMSGVPTGYPKLDEFTGGWLNGNVALIAGRPGQGKTICLLEHAKHAAKLGYPVLFLSLEMPVVSLVYRMISGTLNDDMPYSKLKTGKLNIDQYKNVSNTSVTELYGLPITWYDGANKDVNYLSMMIQKIVREKNIKLVVIDYIQLMSDSQIKGNDEFSTVGSVADKVQSLAKKLNIPFLCATQLNRANEGRGSHRPRLSDMRSSGKLEQMASVVIGLYREDYYAFEKAKEENTMPEFNNEIEYIFLKNRDGNTLTCQLYIDVKTSRISETNIFNNSKIF